MSNPVKEADKEKKPTGIPDKPETDDELVDSTSDDSFPASDPPPMSGSTAGKPDKKKGE